MRIYRYAAAFAAVVFLAGCEGEDGVAGAPAADGSGAALVDPTLVGRHAPGVFDGGGAEIVAHDPVAFRDAVTVQGDAAIGRLAVTTFNGDVDDDGDYEKLYALGARSFSIWAEDGTRTYDSGADFERITAQRYPHNFNPSHDDNGAESRSDAKGPEPEGVTVGRIAGRTFAFIGLERAGGVMVYDVTNPQSARFVQYVNSRDFAKDPESDLPVVGDLGPEGLALVPAEDRPSGAPLRIVGNEVSGTTAIYRIDVIESDWGLLTLIGWLRWPRKGGQARREERGLVVPHERRAIGPLSDDSISSSS